MTKNFAVGRRRIYLLILNSLLVLASVKDGDLSSSINVDALCLPPAVYSTTGLHRHRSSSTSCINSSSYSADRDPNPVFPSVFNQDPQLESSSLNDLDESDSEHQQQEQGQEQTHQANTRFSKFAPEDSENLSPEDFRARLKENMKADLEERRRNDPKRGNQPAKSYLDSLWTYDVEGTSTNSTFSLVSGA